MTRRFALLGIIAAYVWGGLIYPYAHVHIQGNCTSHIHDDDLHKTEHRGLGYHSHCHHVHLTNLEDQDSSLQDSDHSHSGCPACELLWIAHLAPALAEVVEHYCIIWHEPPGLQTVVQKTDTSLPLLRGPPALA